MRGGGDFDVAILEQLAGFVSVRLSGDGVAHLTETEPGGHRWQRVPSTEKRGRVQTSTVTVAVLSEEFEAISALDPNDIEISTFNGSGSGGQNRNKTANCVRMVHRPTGLEAKSESERSLHQNRSNALVVLTARVREARRSQQNSARADARRQQVGTGQRGDKVRTVRVQDGVVTCERTGKKYRLKEYLRGELGWLWGE